MSEPRFPYQPPLTSGGGLTVGVAVPLPGRPVSTTDWLFEREAWKTRAKALEKALRALYEAEGHTMPCAFNRCSCGAVERRAGARAEAAKALRLAPASEPQARDTKGEVARKPRQISYGEFPVCQAGQHKHCQAVTDPRSTRGGDA